MISAEGTLPLFISEVFENLPKIEGGNTTNEEFVQLLALLMGQYASQDFISSRTIHLQDRENGHQLPFAGEKLPLPPAATPSEHTSKTLHRENDSALPEIQSTRPEQIHLRDLHQLFSIGSARAIPGQSTGPTLVENTLEMPFGHSAWDHAMGKKILFMVKQDVGQAKFHLDPPELGRVEIKISVFRNIANVTFLAEHAGVRNALEIAIPRLEAMFRDAGLNLMSVDISHQAFDGQHGPPTHSGSGSGPLNPDMGEHDVSSSGPEKDLMQMETGLVDFYV